ncbi:MAG: TolC family protein [Bacteroidota bacterium]
MNKYISVLVILWLALPCQPKAQDTMPSVLPVKWRLEDCIAYAKRKNITIASLRLSTISTQEDLLQARAAVLPNLNGSASQNLVNGKNGGSGAGGVQTQSNFSSSYGVNSSMIIYNGSYLRNDIRVKELSVQSANLTVKETENDITLSIAQAFFNILLAKENITTLTSVLETSKEQLQQGQQRFDAGSIARKDLLQFQSQVAGDEFNLINANNTFRLNTVTLKQLLLLPPDYDLQITAPDTIRVREALPSLPEAQKLAQQERPEMQNGQLQVQISEIEIEKARAAAKPSVSVGAGLATGYSDNQSAKYLAQLDNNFYQTLGVTLGIPIYSRRVNKTNINKSKLLWQQSQLNLADTRNILNNQVEQAYVNLLNAQERYTAAETQLRTNEEIYRITNEQLRLGAVTTVELLLQKNAYVQALQTFTQAKYNAALYNKIYQFYMGMPVSF